MSNSQPAYDLIPFGGIREIGKNMWAISNQKHIVIVDAGLKFPSEDMYGVDFLLPDTSWLVEHQSMLAGIILTHAHEDHVGGLVPFLKQLESPPPIYASELSLGLLEERITDIKPEYKELLKTVKNRERVEIGSFEVEFLHVCHSISGALGVSINTPMGAIVFTGDFKMDPTPIDQQPTDYFKFAELGEKGVLTLISDSTNATNPGYTISEKEVAQNFINAFYRAKGRIIIATFASSLHRIQQLVNRCEEFERKIAFVGRSMERMTTKALAMGYLKIPEGLQITAEDLDNYPDEKVAVVTTGSQGEPLAALSLMAAGKYRHVTIKPGDTVIISATPIPGNEKSIYQTINQLFARKAEVIYESRKGLHASGHASQEELKLMLNLTRPKYFIPTHGEYRQMLRHAELAYDTGLKKENAFLLDIGNCLRITEEGAQLMPNVQAGELMVAGSGSGHLDQKELKERHKLVKDGVLFVSCVVSPEGKLTGTPKLMSKGFIIEEEPTELYTEVADSLQHALNKRIEDKGSIANWPASVTELVSRFIYYRTRRRPVIVPLVHQLGETTSDEVQPDAV